MRTSDRLCLSWKYRCWGWINININVKISFTRPLNILLLIQKSRENSQRNWRTANTLGDVEMLRLSSSSDRGGTILQRFSSHPSIKTQLIKLTFLGKLWKFVIEVNRHLTILPPVAHLEELVKIIKFMELPSFLM